MNDIKNLVLKFNKYGYSPEVVDVFLKYKTTGAIPDYIKGEEQYKKNGPLSISQMFT